MAIQLLEVRFAGSQFTGADLTSVEIGYSAETHWTRATPHAVVISYADIRLGGIPTAKQVPLGAEVVVGYPDLPALYRGKVTSVAPDSRADGLVIIRSVDRAAFGFRPNYADIDLPLGVTPVFYRQSESGDATARVQYVTFKLDLQDYWIGRGVSLVGDDGRNGRLRFQGAIYEIRAYIDNPVLDRVELGLGGKIA